MPFQLFSSAFPEGGSIPALHTCEGADLSPSLEWSGAPYGAIRVKLGDPEYKAINPAGAVPALDTGEGWVLTQAGAVLQDLARRYPEARLLGRMVRLASRPSLIAGPIS